MKKITFTPTRFLYLSDFLKALRKKGVDVTSDAKRLLSQIEGPIDETDVVEQTLIILSVEELHITRSATNNRIIIVGLRDYSLDLFNPKIIGIEGLLSYNFKDGENINLAMIPIPGRNETFRMQKLKNQPLCLCTSIVHENTLFPLEARFAFQQTNG